MHVHFGGGEPLMRDDFFPIAGKFHKAKLTTSLSSNGFFIDRDMAKQLAGLVNMVGLSIYGSKQRPHEDFTRFPGSFAKLIEAQGLLQASGVANKFVVVLCAKTAPEAVSIIQLAHDLGVAGIQFYTMKAVGNAESDLRLQLNPQEWRTLYKGIFSEAEKYPDIKFDFGLDNDPVVASYLGREPLLCACGRFSVVVKPSGDVSACSLLIKVLGNLHSDSLLDLWQNSPDLCRIRAERKNPCSLTYLDRITDNK